MRLLMARPRDQLFNRERASKTNAAFPPLWSVLIMDRKENSEKTVQALMRLLPSMDKILSDRRLAEFEEHIGRSAVKDVCVQTLS